MMATQKESKVKTLLSLPPCKAIGGTLQSLETKTSTECLSALEKYNTENSRVTKSMLPGGKVILVGDSKVGKTCLFVRYAAGLFSDNYKSTIGLDFNLQQYSIYDVPFSLAIWDTAGQERFQSLTKTYHRGSHACIVAFDLNEPRTLQSVERWCNEVKTYSEEEDLKVFLVGTKSDLCNQTDRETVIALANKLKAEYWEVSAKNDQNVSELFNRIAYLVWERQLFRWRDIQNSTTKQVEDPGTQLPPPNTSCSC